MLFSEDFKKSHNLDVSMQASDVLEYYLDIVIKKLRGRIPLIGIKKGSKFYRGKHVKLTYRKYIHFGNNTNLNDFVEIQGLSKIGINFGNNVNIGKGTIIRGTGSINKIGKGFKCGNNFGCGDYCFFGCTGGIEIGNDCIMGQSVRMHSQNHKFENSQALIRAQGTEDRGIKIGNNCWIGSGVVILDGVHIGNGVVIGANTLVSKNIEDNQVVVGNPMRVIKVRDNGTDDRK